MKMKKYNLVLLVYCFLINGYESGLSEITTKLKEVKTSIKTIFGGIVKNVTDTLISGGLDTNLSFVNGTMEDFKNMLTIHFPGTKWCGPGNVAYNDDEVGRFSGTDQCCRHHDMCPISIAARTTEYGLKNTGFFTRSHCSCDKEFYDCLKEVNTLISIDIGTTYFNVLGPDCFESLDCSTSSIKCRGDGENLTEYKWFNNPKF